MAARSRSVAAAAVRTPQLVEAELRFPAMGSEAHLIVTGDGAAQLARQGRERVADLEARWSRFIASSEISRLNENAGYPTIVSRETIALVQRALDAWDVTGGRYDPTLLGAVIRAGYDGSFATLPAQRPALATRDWRTAGAARVDVDEQLRMITLPRGVGFDPGGIGKGYAADIVTDELIAAGARGTCVNIGGDMRVRGTAPSGGPWTVDVLDPVASEGDGREPQPVATIALADGAVATSSRARRVWQVGESVRHHLLDPESGEPVANDIVAVTVIASEGWRAEVLAKAAFVAGLPHALEVLDERGVAGAIFDGSDRMHVTRDWSRFSAAAA
jgi:thiamine biosynthesis lipoprotein